MRVLDDDDEEEYGEEEEMPRFFFMLIWKEKFDSHPSSPRIQSITIATTIQIIKKTHTLAENKHRLTAKPLAYQFFYTFEWKMKSFSAKMENWIYTHESVNAEMRKKNRIEYIKGSTSFYVRVLFSTKNSISSFWLRINVCKRVLRQNQFQIPWFSPWNINFQLFQVKREKIRAIQTQNNLINQFRDEKIKVPTDKVLNLKEQFPRNWLRLKLRAWAQICAESESERWEPKGKKIQCWKSSKAINCAPMYVCSAISWNACST